MLAGCLVCAGAQEAAKPAPVSKADAKFKAIYVADEAWRRAQPGNQSAEDEQRHLEPPHLPHADAATQAMELAHWQNILAELSKVDVKALSKDERLNFEVYSAQIEVAKNGQLFKEYERPVNSDSQFWGFIAPLNGNESDESCSSSEYCSTPSMRHISPPEARSVGAPGAGGGRW